MKRPNHWIYSRKSRALGDPDDPNLMSSHRSALLELARRDEVVVPADQIILEVGSGETIPERPDFQRLLETWERLPRDAGGIVYVTAIDRLSRGDLGEQARVQSALARANIKVRSPGRIYDLRDVDEQFMFDIEALFARRELSLFKKRQELKRAELLRGGRSPNLVPPFPYLLDRANKTWVPHPQRFPIVQAWCQEVFQMSLRQIADRWKVPLHTVHDTLRNPAIAGWPCRRSTLHHGEKPWRCKNRPLPPEEWLWPERQGEYPPVISLEEWRRIQQVIESRRMNRSPVGTEKNAWCRRVLRFVSYPDRQPHLSVLGATAGRQYTLTYEIRPPGVPALYVPRDIVHEATAAALTVLCSDPALLMDALQEYQRQRLLAIRSNAEHPSVKDLEKRLLAARRSMLRAQEDLNREEDEELAVGWRSNVEKFRREVEAIKLQLQEARQPFEPNADLDEMLPTLQEHIEYAPRAIDLYLGRGEFADQAPDFLSLSRLTNALISRVWVKIEIRPGYRRLMDRHVVGWEPRLERLRGLNGDG